MKSNTFIVVLVIIAIVFSVYVYSNLSKGICPYCGGKLVYQDKIYGEKGTSFRYVCENSVWHIVDSPIKF
jgi:hypothetical protein